MNRNSVACLVFVVGVLPMWVWAGAGPMGGPRKPPPEAVEACKDKQEGATVSVTTPRGETMTATCRKVDGQLVAVPDGAPPCPGNGPPPEGAPKP